MNLQVVELKQVITSRQPGVKAGLGAFDEADPGRVRIQNLPGRAMVLPGFFKPAGNEPILILNPGGSRI
jgi:hypothetical protein